MSGYRNSLVVSDGGQRIPTSGAGPDVNNLLKGDGDDEDCDFDGAIDEDSAQRVGMK